jgi:putative endonuclease
MYFLYILRTSSDDLYIGVSKDLEQRLDAHHRGQGAEWTQRHPNARLVYREEHPTLSSARKRENQMKRWSRSKKEALLAGNLPLLKELARCRTRKSTGAGTDS